MRLKTTLHNPDQIRPLEVVVERTVRFEELDPMGVMWHGRYASWLEDGREALGRRHGVSYLDFYNHQCMTPLKRLTLDYRRPLLHDRTYRILTRLLWTESARMDFDYAILDEDDSVLTTAATTQLFTTLQGELLLDPPAFYRDFLARWKQGELA